MPILKQEEYKGYIIHIMDTVEFDCIWYKILVDKPKWVCLRRMGTTATNADECIDKAKRYIDEYSVRLHDKLVRVLREKGIELI